MATVLSKIRPFSALRQRNFRLVWFSTILAGSGQQMETVVLGWFVLQLTNSPFLVGLVTTARLAATGLGAYAGAIADRLPRRLVLMTVQTVMALLAVVMFTLIAADLIEVWHVFAIAFLGGLARIFDQPARQALVADSVGASQLSSGLALNIAGMNMTMIAGPILGGALFAIFGPEGSYAFMSLLYTTGVGILFFIRSAPISATRAAESVWRSMFEGLRYARQNNLLVAALVMAAIANLTALPFLFTLMPVYARDIVGTESTGLGILMSASGIGALIGSLTLASIQSTKRATQLLIGTMVVWHVMTLVVVNTSQFEVAFALIILMGTMQSLSMVLIATILMEITAPEYRGRVMGLRMLAVYTLPFGSAISGAMAAAFGAPATAMVNAVVGIALIGVLVILIPNLRHARETEQVSASGVA